MAQRRGSGYQAEHLATLRGEVMERLAKVDTRLDAALEGVANFKAFQTEARSFFTTYKATTVARNEDLDRHTQAVKDTLSSQNQKREDSRGRTNLIIAAGLLLFTALTWYHDIQTPRAVRDVVQQTVHDSMKSELGAKR